jgi:hypothetical protein
LRPLLLILLLPLIGCMKQSEELLPVAASIKRASIVRTVELVVRPAAAAQIAALDQKAAARAEGGAAHLPFAEMMPAMVRDVTRAWGLSAGRELALKIEIDAIELAGTAATLLGGSRDRLAGSVFIRDAATDEPLGQLYVDVVNSHSGPVGLLIRGGGIREELANEFAIHIARALTGRRDRPR